MDLLDTLLHDRAADLSYLLIDSGFSADQASRFLHQASQMLAELMTDAELIALAEGHAEQDLLQQVDLAVLADSAGIDPALAETGLRAVLPELLALLIGGVLQASPLPGASLGDLAIRIF